MKIYLNLYDEDSDYIEEIDVSNHKNIFMNFIIQDNYFDISNLDADNLLLSVEECINSFLVINEIELEFQEEITTLKNLKENISDVFDNIEMITIDFKNTNVKEFLDNNPMLLEKKICLGEEYTIKDFKKIVVLLKEIKGYEKNIYIKMDNHSKPVCIQEIYDIVIKNIETTANYIMSLNLSPMETIMFTYDIVKNRVYKHEQEFEGMEESRDLKNVLSGDKIVCEGFANHFDALLSYMGFNTTFITLVIENSSVGHIRNMVYVVDQKYGIDGVYSFDSTWDSKEENNDNCFYKYLWFAKTRKEIEILENNKYTYRVNDLYDKDLVEMLKKIRNADSPLAVKDILTACISNVNFMSRLIYGDNLVSIEKLHLNPYKKYTDLEFENILLIVKEMQEKFNKPIYANTYLEVLRNVRKVQYYINPDSCIYDINEMYKAYIESQWKFKDTVLSDTERLMLAIFGEEPKEKSKRDNFITNMNKTNICRDIEGTKLAKVLSLYLNSKK